MGQVQVCGVDWSWRSVGAYLDRLDEGVAVNAPYLAPHGTIRLAVIGPEDRQANADELRTMRAMLADALKEGAVCMSTWSDVSACDVRR